ncbi:hypothetical protein ACT7DA_20565 [Bacillus pacificus]
MNYLKEECHKWYIFVKTLFKGFPTSFLSEKNDYEMYFTEEQNRYKKWIEGRNLIEFVEELQQHYEQVTNHTSEKMFYKGLLDKYGQKLDKVQKRKNTKGARRATYRSRKNKERGRRTKTHSITERAII